MAGSPGPSSAVGELKVELPTRPSLDLRPSREYGEAVLALICLCSFGEGSAPWREYDLGGYVGCDS